MQQRIIEPKARMSVVRVTSSDFSYSLILMENVRFWVSSKFFTNMSTCIPDAVEGLIGKSILE